MKININTLVGDVVSNNYKTAAIFKNYGIDYCCNGNRSIGEASISIDVEPLEIISKLKEVEVSSSLEKNYQKWSLEFLCDYIYNHHHQYVERTIPEILHYLDKICNVHGEKHQDLFEIKELFKKSAGELTMHMKKEELVLFPHIKKISSSKRNKNDITKLLKKSIEASINDMHHDHDEEGERFRSIAELTDNYTVPKGACNSYKIAYSLLKEFEEDLHKHIHLENNILFKKAVILENNLKK